MKEMIDSIGSDDILWILNEEVDHQVLHWSDPHDQACWTVWTRCRSGTK